MNFKPIMLAILDGWGLAPPGPGNAVDLAQTPNMDKFWTGYPHTKLKASGKAVGLPEGEMGNSECGHLTLGAGRIVYQDFSRISLSISSGSFFRNKAFISACEYVKTHHSNLHHLGIFGYGSVHADRSHLYALLRLAKNQGLKPEQVELDIFTDGRDSPSKSAISLLSELKEVIKEIGVGEISSICGRYFAMDRDKRWQRTQKSYEALTSGIGEKANLVKETIEKYRFKINLKEFNKNLIDPIKLTFDSKVYGKTIEEIIDLETVRQMDKSNSNNIGYFQQNIFKYIYHKNTQETNWSVPKQGFDIINDIDKIYVEMKNKHNTMNSSSSQKTFMRMQSKLLNDRENRCYLVEVIAKNSQNIMWKVSLDGQSSSNENIRRVSVDKFYEIVTGEKEAFKQLVEALPQVMDDVLEEIQQNGIENTVFKELEGIDENILKSLYLLSFKKYEGFDSINI